MMSVEDSVIQELEEGFNNLRNSEECKSLLKKHLTREVFDRLKTRRSKMGATLLDVVRSGLANLDSGVGVYAPDADSYETFKELFDPIIEEYHAGFKAGDTHPETNYGDLDSLVNLDPEGKHIISTRVRCGRSIVGYSHNPCMTEEQYKAMELGVSTVLGSLELDELKGTYLKLSGMDSVARDKLISEHLLFKEGDRFLQKANACRFWPTGRGIFLNEARNFLVWCGEEDHLRVISMENGGDLKTAYDRLLKGIRALEAELVFARDDRLGWLTFCPTNLGTTIRASVHIKLPKLGADRKRLEEMAAKYNLQVRGTRGEHTESEGGVFDISNKRRLGLTEGQAVAEMQHGVLELIKQEKAESAS